MVGALAKVKLYFGHYILSIEMTELLCTETSKEFLGKWS